MGDVSNQHLCQRFIEAFGEDIFKKFSMVGDFVREQCVDFEDDFNVRMRYVIRDNSGDEFSVLGTLIFYSPDGDDDEQTADFLADILFDKDESKRDEVLAKLKKLGDA